MDYDFISKVFGGDIASSMQLNELKKIEEDRLLGEIRVSCEEEAEALLLSEQAMREDTDLLC